MEQELLECQRLYDLAFPGEGESWLTKLFSFAAPYLRTVCEDGKPLSMLFSIPCLLQTEKEAVEARYLYAVATHPEARGRGLAGRLLRQVIKEGYPVFLRPMQPSLFDFYARVGFAPFSPHATERGVRAPRVTLPIRALTGVEYLAARREFLTPPYTVPSAAFLALAESLGGAIGAPDRFAALYERQGTHVRFKEWLGDIADAPVAAAYLGADTYELRTPTADGAPFGMGVGVPPNARFLIALD